MSKQRNIVFFSLFWVVFLAPLQADDWLMEGKIGYLRFQDREGSVYVTELFCMKKATISNKI